MKTNNIICIDSRSSFFSQKTSWNIIPLQLNAEVNFINKSNKYILCFVVYNSRELSDIIKSRLTEELNIPAIFILSDKCQECVNLLLENDHTNIFILEQGQWLVKSFINHLFNDHQHTESNSLNNNFAPKDFTKKEMQIIEVLSQSVKRIASRRELYEKIWGGSLHTNKYSRCSYL